MRKTVLILILAAIWIPLLLRGQTVLSFTVDTLFVSSGDSLTVLSPRGRVLSVGDTVKAWVWYCSDDSLDWRSLNDSHGWPVSGNRLLLDTLPLYRYYCAYLSPNPNVTYIVWKVSTIVYRSLSPPTVTDGSGILNQLRDSVVTLLRYDSVVLRATFTGVYPDSAFFLNGNSGRFKGDSLVVWTKGDYKAAGYIYNRRGVAVDSAFSSVVVVDFNFPFDRLLVKSWADSHDGRPKVDTLQFDTCRHEVVVDTLRFSLYSAYKYQFAPVLRSFSKDYGFTLWWEHDGFATVNLRDSVLSFDPVGVQHTGSYVLWAWPTRNIKMRAQYKSPVLRVVAWPTSNSINGNYMDAVVTRGVVYDAMGRCVAMGVSGTVREIVLELEYQAPRGVYILRDGEKTYKFIK